MISATPSLSSSSDRSISNSSEFSVDAMYNNGSNHEDLNFMIQLPKSSSEVSVNGVKSLNTTNETNLKDRNISNVKSLDREVHITNGDEEQDNIIEKDSSSLVVGSEILKHIDGKIWEPPEPEDPEDDLESSVAYNDDDDDEYSDGTKWGKPTSLSDFNDEGNGSHSFKEEKQKAMEEVFNGKFKTLVSQLLNSADYSSLGKDGESWLDIVTSLSWEAALFLKPDAVDGKTMDPDGYVKVKCIPTGSRSQSELIKGLVFKKHAAHKHMPTSLKNPRLLLIRGIFGENSSGLSSFKLMDQEKDHLKSVIDMVDLCHPNVILVEKSVSRDVQESILAKGTTLVYDMKLHRLERIARCTGSQIVSSDTLMNQKLKQCDFLRFERFVEEHADPGEGGKIPTKTLMFIEGCPTRLGCTILLKGSNGDELKKIKQVIQCAVFMAYHLILETSFLADQKAMFSTIIYSDTSPQDQEPLAIKSDNSNSPRLEYSSDEMGEPVIDIPISNGSEEEGGAAFSQVPYNPAIFSGFSSLSSSLKKVIGDRFPLASASYLSTYLGFNGIEADMESKGSSDEEQLPIPLDSERKDVNDEKMQTNGYTEVAIKDNTETVLNSTSILVLMSSKNALRGSMCEQSHFSHIVFYRNFDVPLGKFLRENLLNQKSHCKTCGELPEAHFYYYAHYNKQLTIQVKGISKRLPGETVGKLWMWSRCGKCKTSKPTKRVVISTDARGLSFGKFLELSFSQPSNKLSSCGHCLEKDFLYFFGLGHMVAMFRYSPVTTYTISLPPQKLVFSSSIKLVWLRKEFENVYMKGMLLFSEISTFLKKIKSQFTSSTLNLRGSLKDFADIEEMLKQETLDFESNIENAVTRYGNPNTALYKILSLNRLRWELLLESCIWERRLHSLLLPDPSLLNNSIDMGTETKVHDLETRENSLKTNSDWIEKNEPVMTETPIRGPVKECEAQDDQCNTDSSLDRIIPISSDSDTVKGISYYSLVSEMENSKGWWWIPFTEIRETYMKDIQRGFLLKFESISSHAIENLPTVYQLITEEGSRLHIPLGDDNYIVSDYENEFSSVISCALLVCLKDKTFEDHQKEILNRTATMPAQHWSSASSLEILNRTATMPALHWSSTNSLDSTSSFLHEESRFSSFDGLNLLDSLVPSETVNREVSLGVTKSFGKGRYSVICLYANHFRDLRSRCCPSELDYIASLSRCRNWDAKGGKSKSIFAKTLDDRFIIKEIKKIELESFLKFAPDYFKYMNHSFDSGSQTCLAKVLGIYQVIIRMPKSGKETRHDLMVMENLSFGRKISRQYDLKGALHARFTTDGSEDVLLDQNFVNDMNSSPLYVISKTKSLLERAVWNDTTFLNSINVMDYSLLVGVDTQRQELVCGIIDYLRQYTWDKQLETWVKSSLVVPKNVLPTVISPKEYKKRFRKFMKTHMLSVPDHWCSQKSADPCNIKEVCS